MKKIMSSVSVVVFLMASAQAFAGSVSGTVTFDGATPKVKMLKTGGKDNPICPAAGVPDDSLVVNKANKGIQNVVVYLADIKTNKKFTPKEAPVLDQKGCRYVPHVVIAPAGVPVAIKNSDSLRTRKKAGQSGGILHNVKASGKANQFNVAMPKFKPEMRQTFKAPKQYPAFVPMACDVHTWMKGWVVLADHPYYVISNADGKFDLKGVPAGSYTLNFWHEKLGTQSKKVTVGAGAATVNTNFKAKP